MNSQSQSIFHFNERKFRYAGIPLLALFIMLLVKKNVYCLQFSFWIDWLITILFTFSIWNSNYRIMMLFRKRFSELKQTSRRILISFIVTTFNTIIICIVLDLILFNVFAKTGPYQVNLQNLLVGILSNTFVLSVYEGMFFFYRWNEAMIAAEELKKANIQSHYDSLKNQVNPHFLFNSLNTLSSLVEEDPKSAVSFIHKMSNVYRYLLQGNEKPLTTVRKELEFIESYIYLLKTRFDESLHISIHVDDKYMECEIPPHTVQMLIENAVKHNEVSNDYPLHTDIYTEDKKLIVKNKLQRKQSLVKSNGVGLQNIMQRVLLLGGEEVLVSDDGEYFTVKIPLFNCR